MKILLDYLVIIPYLKQGRIILKKVCHLTSADMDGIPRLLRESALAVNSGFMPVIIAVGKDKTENGIKFIGIKKPEDRLERIFSSSKDLFEAGMMEDADIYQIHDPILLPFALKFKKAGKKVIFDSHEFYGKQLEVRDYMPKFFRKIVSKCYKVYESYICKRIDAVIAVCTLKGKDYFENRCKKSLLIENLPDINTFKRKVNYLTDEGEDNTDNSIVYIGALSEARGINNLIGACYKAGVRLVLCGPFDSKEYENNLREMKEFSCVDYRGILHRNEIIELLNECAVGASTLRHVGQYSEIDTLPTKVYEYMAMEIPVLISDTDYAKSILENNRFGIAVNPDDIDDMSEKIKLLLSDPVLREKMGVNGRNFVTERYKNQVEKGLLINLYNDLLKDQI